MRIAGFAWSLLFYGLLLGTGWNDRIAAWAARLAAPLALPPDASGPRASIARAMRLVWRDGSCGSALLYLLLFFGIRELCYLPATIGRGYIWPKHHGLLTIGFGGWVVDHLKDTSIMVVVLAMLLFGLFGLKRRFPRRWWLVLGLPAGLALAFADVLDPWRNQVNFTLAPLPDGELRTRLQDLARQANVEVAGIDVENASRAHTLVDAYLAGHGPTRRVVLLDNMVDRYPADEIVVGVAHEMGHIQEREARPLRRWLAGAAVVPVLFLLDRLLSWASRRRRLRLSSDTDPKLLPLVFVVWLLVTFAIGPPLHFRTRASEREADAYALELTERPDAFVSLMARLARDNRADIDPAPVWTLLYGHHPALAERVRAAQAWAAAHGQPDPVARVVAAAAGGASPGGAR